jgi:hypothetical protein
MVESSVVPSWQRIYLAACCAVIGFALAYSVCEYAGWPRLAYDPILRTVYMGRPPLGKLPLGYLGLVAWGVGGAVIAAGAAVAAGAALRRPLGDRWLRLVGGWALTAAALAGLFQTWNLWPF